MEDDNEDNLKNKKDLNIAGKDTALDIFRPLCGIFGIVFIFYVAFIFCIIYIFGLVSFWGHLIFSGF